MEGFHFKFLAEKSNLSGFWGCLACPGSRVGPPPPGSHPLGGGGVLLKFPRRRGSGCHLSFSLIFPQLNAVLFVELHFELHLKNVRCVQGECIQLSASPKNHCHLNRFRPQGGVNRSGNQGAIRFLNSCISYRSSTDFLLKSKLCTAHCLIHFDCQLRSMIVFTQQAGLGLLFLIHICRDAFPLLRGYLMARVWCTDGIMVSAENGT